MPAFRKETHYFSNYFHRGLGWYRAHFPLAAQVRGDGEERQRLTGEASPYYVFHPHAAAF